MPIEIPEDLVEAVRSSNAIAFVGSGLSKPAGAPSWDDLLLYVASTIGRFAHAEHHQEIEAATEAIKHGRLINAATILSFVAGANMRNVIADAIRDCRWNRGGMESQESLLRLNLRAIVTTNYDRLLEMKLQEMGVKAPQIASYSHGDFVEAIRPGRRFILHLHGDVDHPSDIVATWGDYDALLSSKVLDYVSSLIVPFTTLWIGYSHSDPDVMLTLAQKRIRDARKAFQVVQKSDYELAALCHTRNIMPLYADSYEDIPPFLEELAARTEAPKEVRFLMVGDRGHKHDVKEGNVVGGIATAYFLGPPQERLRGIRHAFANPRIVHKSQEFEFTPERFFSCCAATQSRGEATRIAVIAPPGVGKTVLVARFAQWLGDQTETSASASDGLRPIVIYLNADSLSEAVTNINPLWHQVERIVAQRTAFYTQEAKQDPLSRWCQRNPVFVLFDGIDEFGARRKGELEELLNNLSSLATGRHFSVVLTCRTVFWSQQVLKRQRELWEEYEIQPFTADEIADIVGPGGLGQFAYDNQGRVKPGVNNRLIVSFVLELRQGREHPESFKSRFELYEKWVRSTIARATRYEMGVLPEHWLSLFKETAFSLLEGMTESIPLPGLDDGRRAPFDECLAIGILTASSNREEVRLYHESLGDFFVSWVLLQSFQGVLKVPHDPEALNALPLARVNLDFLQPSVYGFLHEKLGDGYLTALREALSGVDLAQWKTKLVRNLVEYVGMTYEGGPDDWAVVHWLLDLMRSGLDPVIRYNAARALERIHAWAPRPYYDYMSDWGDRDWTKEHNLAKEDRPCPWAIRGYRIRNQNLVNRRPGKYPCLAVCRGVPKNTSLQAYVSAELAKMLKQLLEELRDTPPRSAHPEKLRPIDCLLINYSHAWARWFHDEHRDRLEDLRKTAVRYEDIVETQENLKEWVDY